MESDDDQNRDMEGEQWNYLDGTPATTPESDSTPRQGVIVSTVNCQSITQFYQVLLCRDKLFRKLRVVSIHLTGSKQNPLEDLSSTRRTLGDSLYPIQFGYLNNLRTLLLNNVPRNDENLVKLDLGH